MPPCLSLDCLWALVEHASDMVIVLDADQQVVFMNQRASHLLGYSRQEVVGQAAGLLFVTADAQQRIAGFGGCRCGDSARRTLLARRRDGVILPLTVDVRGVRLEGDERDCWALTVRADASAPASVESRSQTEGLFRTLVQNVDDYAITMIDRAGAIVTWNRGAERLTGRSVEDAIETPYADGFDPDAQSRQIPQRLLDHALEKGRCEAIVPRRRADGSLFRAHCVLSPIRDSHGHLIGYSEIMRDVVEVPGCLTVGEVAPRGVPRVDRTSSDPSGLAAPSDRQ